MEKLEKEKKKGWTDSGDSEEMSKGTLTASGSMQNLLVILAGGQGPAALIGQLPMIMGRDASREALRRVFVGEEERGWEGKGEGESVVMGWIDIGQ